MANTKYFNMDNFLAVNFLIINIIFICDCVNYTEDFKTLVDRDIFVDKSEFIKEFLECESKIALISRPSGFGKRINLDMLKNFLEIEVDEYGNPIQKKNYEKYFKNLRIVEYKNIIKDYYGKYPVIYVNFKNVKISSNKEIPSAIELSIKEAFLQHRYLLQVETLGEHNKKILQKYFSSNNLKEADIKCSLIHLSEFLTRHFKKRTFILVNDFDKPYYKAYLSESIYFRGFRTSSIKIMFNKVNVVNSEYIEKGLITSILPLKDYAIFSELDNYKLYSIRDSKFSSIFGFTDHEVSDLLKKLQKVNKKQIIRQRYGGYCFNNDTNNVNEYNKLYQPRSVMEYLENENKLVYDDSKITPDQGLLQLYINENTGNIIAKMFQLIKNETVNAHWNEAKVTNYWVGHRFFPQPGSTFFILGIHLGYLNIVGKRLVKITNADVHNIFLKIIRTCISKILQISNKEIVEIGDLMYESFNRKNFPKLISRLNSFFTVFFKEITDKYKSYKITKMEGFDGCIYLFVVSSKYKNDFEIFTRRDAKKKLYRGILADLVLIPVDGKDSEAYIINYNESESSAKEEEKIMNQTSKTYKILSAKFSYIKTICNINISFHHSNAETIIPVTHPANVKIIYETVNL